jgi:hypothetical protein
MGRRLGDSGTLLERLLDKVIVNQTTDCWEFQGGKNNIGYGMIRDNKKMRTAHRVSYEEHISKIPAGLCVMHSCDNPICCNPKHLSLGTHKQNTQDMFSKGRAKPFGFTKLKGGGMKGKIMPRTTCVHCLRSISNPAYARRHGDKCRLKPQA